MTELTILLPCLNESDTLGICISKARQFLESNNISGEILISDNGSTDGSVEIAEGLGARVIHASIKGYGGALQAGIKSARGKYTIMGDADDSYDFLRLENFVEKLREGCDLVMGNRFAGGIKKGAMPIVHRYLGNPVLSFIGKLFFKSQINDFHCGLRGFNTDKIRKLDLICDGMEFASEMVVKATILGYSMTETPIYLYPDGRKRPPHLRTWRDGWRHLVFLLMYSPKWLFFVPSILIFILSLGMLLVLLPGTLYINNIGLDMHSITIAGALMVLSYQLFLFALFVRIYSINKGLYPAEKKHIYFYNKFSLEKGIGVGLSLFVAGIVVFGFLIIYWASLSFGEIEDTAYTFRFLISSICLLALGVQTIFASFVIRVLGINPRIEDKGAEKNNY